MASFNIVVSEQEYQVVRFALLKVAAAADITMPVLQAMDAQVVKQQQSAPPKATKPNRAARRKIAKKKAVKKGK